MDVQVGLSVRQHEPPFSDGAHAQAIWPRPIIWLPKARLSEFDPRRQIKRVEVRVVEVDHDRCRAGYFGGGLCDELQGGREAIRGVRANVVNRRADLAEASQNIRRDQVCSDS